jgi:flagellar protein FlaF
LPEDLRNNVGSLAVFIFKRTFELLGRPEAAKVDALVDINRSIAAGLAARPQPPHQTEPGAPVPPSASGVA